MPKTTPHHEDVWQDDFVLLMDQFSDITSQPLPDVATTPKQRLYNENKLQLFCYEPLDVEQKKTPILLVYALVNRPSILDIEPDRSLVLRLLEQGYPVYMIDWGYPDNSDCLTSLNDYINGMLQRCVQRVKRHGGVEKIDLLGICQGGVFSLCYSALEPNDVRNLITLVTPVNFHSDGNILNLWTNGMDANTLANRTGNISGALIGALFKSLKPFQLNRDKYRHLSHLVKKKENLKTFMRMEKWLNDNPDLAGVAAREFMESFYQQNQLHNGTLRIGGKHVELGNIKCPVLNLYASKDHIVPPSSTQALGQHIKPKLYSEKALDGGHIGAFTSLKTQKVLILAITKKLG